MAGVLVLALGTGGVGLRMTWTGTARIGLYSAGVGLTGGGEVVRVMPGGGADPGPYLPGTRVLAGTGSAADLARRAEEQRAWLRAGCLPGATATDRELARTALLDLHVLAAISPGMVAGASPKWRYVWPRDSSMVAVALARTGHRADAAGILAFLQRVQPPDGRFQARYLPDGSGVPDDRGIQLDGTGWALWALGELTRVTPAGERPALLGRLRALLDRSTRAAIRAGDTRSGLPRPSADYWERQEGRPTLGTAAPLLAGLQAATWLYRDLGLVEQADRAGAAAARLETAVVRAFGPTGYQRYPAGRWRGGGAGMDGGVAMLLPPFTQAARPQVLDAFRRAPQRMRRPAGGLAPGEGWRDDGISWTPQTALFALVAAVNGDRATARRALDWLARHRTELGALPEKVLADGSPAAVAPLSWTAGMVLLTLDEVDAGPDVAEHAGWPPGPRTRQDAGGGWTGEGCAGAEAARSGLGSAHHRPGADAADGHRRVPRRRS